MDNQTPLSGIASEHRGVPQNQPEDHTVKPSVNPVRKPMSFSNTVKASLFPRKDQAIIYPVIDGIQVKDYVIETGKKVDPKNILFASRMSNNRVCIYLVSREVVEKFVENEGGITINDIFVPVRKLIMPAKKIVISNVSPCIPHHVLEEKLKDAGLRLVSPISFMGAGIGLEEYKHVLSFRRQVFIAEDPATSVPSSLLVTHDSEEYRVYLSDDQLRCFRCKDLGHVAAKCPNQTEEDAGTSILQTVSNKRPPPSSAGEEEPRTPNQAEIRHGTHESDAEDFTDHPLQGTAVVTSPPQALDVTSAITSPPQPINIDSFRTPESANSSQRKPKRMKLDESSESYDEIQSLWSQGTDKIMTFIDFADFLKSVKGKDKPIEVARRYTNDIEGLIDLVKEAKPLISNRAPKERCGRLIKALKRALISEGKDTVSPPLSRASSVESLTRTKSVDSSSSEQSSF